MKLEPTMLIIIVVSSQPKEWTTTVLVHIRNATVVHDSDRKTITTITADVTSDLGTCSMAMEPTGMVLFVCISAKLNGMLRSVRAVKENACS